MQETRRQHTVSKFYLKGFADGREQISPRFEIALAKAGDLGQTSIFTGSGRPRTSTTPRRRVLGPQYRVCCSTCGKVFTRSTTSATIRKHKNTYGFPCHGRYGHRV